MPDQMGFLYWNGIKSRRLLYNYIMRDTLGFEWYLLLVYPFEIHFKHDNERMNNQMSFNCAI